MHKNLMRSLALAALLGAAPMLSGCEMMGGATAQSVTPTSANIVSAIADPARPTDDTGVANDINRKPAEMLAFGGVRPGMKIGELIPGAGYMTRLFSKAVGPTGKVYLFNGPAAAGRPLGFQPILDDKTNYPNVSSIQTDFLSIPAPEPLDLIWTSQNYHDMHNPGRNLDIAAANKAVMAALKPGGIYVVLDHATAPGVAFNAQIHRIDPEMVKKEVLAAGFEFVGESTVLRNPADPHDKTVFDPSIRHKTDQFMFKFKKPG